MKSGFMTVTTAAKVVQQAIAEHEVPRSMDLDFALEILDQYLVQHGGSTEVPFVLKCPKCREVEKLDYLAFTRMAYPVLNQGTLAVGPRGEPTGQSAKKNAWHCNECGYTWEVTPEQQKQIVFL